MVERRLGEVASPVESDADSAEGGENLVTEVLAALEAHITGPPHAVESTNPLWLANDLFKYDLKWMKG